MSKEELIICLDRLSRFKLPEESYFRVFSDIISKHLISPKYSKKELEALCAEDLSKLTKLIWNKSTELIYGKKVQNTKILKVLSNLLYKNLDSRTKTLINTDLHIDPILNNLSNIDIPINLKFLINAKKNTNLNDIKKTRNEKKLLFPIEKIIIVEGITEEILLPIFAKKLKKDFFSNGIYLIGAGGKSKSPALYLKIKNKVKAPITILFDEDASEICSVLKKNLNKHDKIIIIKKGEFEDILSKYLIKRTLNNEYKPATPLNIKELKNSEKMCLNIENFYKTRHLGEFKKAKFAKLIGENIKYKTDITDDIKEILNNIL
ncbi:MAG: ATP-dependent endonuclease [Cyanobacteria bacterium SIG29]|nr:ATP-dependent endonuclease [Cyanobacteria bacterium SIG29]